MSFYGENDTIGYFVFLGDALSTSACAISLPCVERSIVSIKEAAFPSRCFLHVLSILAFVMVSTAYADTPAQILEGYSAQAGTVPAPSRGQQFFTMRHGHDWACATCHGAMPTGNAQHAATGKTIAPLAPAFNPERFTNATKTEKWLRRNCGDVVGRDCTPLEKADILSWLMTLKP